MHPSTRFIRGLTASEASWIEEIRSGRPGSDDPETVLARVKQALESQVNDVRACELLSRLDALSDEAMELAFHNIEPEKLPPEEKRRREAQRATHYRQRQIQGLGGPWEPGRPSSVVLTTRWGVEPQIAVAPGRTARGQQRSGGAVQPSHSGSVRADAAPGRSDPAAKTNLDIEERK